MAWRSLPGSDIVTAGSVNFDAVRGGRSTQVSVHLQYAPPAGKAGALVASLFGREPSQTIREDLRHFKQLLEAGEIPRATATRIGASDASRLLGRQREDSASRPSRIPVILNPRDAIVKVTTTAICGSDLHIYDGYIPTMQKGDVLGHEFMGEVVEVGKDNTRLKVGDRVVVPFTIACGHCYFCKEQLWSLCDNSNPNAWMAEKLYGYSASGLFGYSHMYGGYPGGQAEYARVPFADVGPLKVPDIADRRAGALSLRHLPDRLHGGRELPDQAGRHGRGVGLRPGRAVRDQERLPARRRARHRDRSLPRTAGAGVLAGRRGDAELRGGRRARRAPRT